MLWQVCSWHQPSGGRGRAVRCLQIRTREMRTNFANCVVLVYLPLLVLLMLLRLPTSTSSCCMRRNNSSSLLQRNTRCKLLLAGVWLLLRQSPSFHSVLRGVWPLVTPSGARGLYSLTDLSYFFSRTQMQLRMFISSRKI